MLGVRAAGAQDLPEAAFASIPIRMSFVRRQTLVLIAAVLMANPVMACCVDVVSSAAASDTTHSPPCHSSTSDGERPAQHSDQHPCSDCCGADFVLPQVDTRVSISLAASELALPPTPAASFPIAHARPVVSPLKTGPPGDRPLRSQTPLALKQRFLI